MNGNPLLTQHTITVLLVDDQPMIGEAVRRELAGESDIVFHYCKEALRAVEQANAIGPTLILQDLVMPDLDGLELVKAFRANEATRETPLIVLSTKEEAEVKAREADRSRLRIATHWAERPQVENVFKAAHWRDADVRDVARRRRPRSTCSSTRSRGPTRRQRCPTPGWVSSSGSGR